MKVKSKILVVDDEQDLREILEFNLTSEGYEVDVAASAEEALEMPLENYNLILLDVMMGGITGYKMADMVRKKRNLMVPIIFLTAKSAENDLLTGFNVGGDDYISKPFSVKELLVRIRAVLKRSEVAPGKITRLEHKGLIVDISGKSVFVDKEKVMLTRKEFQILVHLMQNRGKYISREELLSQVWSNDVVVTDRNVDVNITRLRKKLGTYSKALVSQTGFGYCFNAE